MSKPLLHDHAHVLPLSLEPLVFYAPLWSTIENYRPDDVPPVPSEFALRMRHKPVTWVRCLTWNCGTAWCAKKQAAERDMFREQIPLHRLVWAANTYREYMELSAAGLDVVYASHNHFISPTTFRPLAPVAGREFKAVYSAKFMAHKRHELLTAVNRPLLVGYNFSQTREAVDRLRSALQSPHFANEEYASDRLSPEQMNEVYNRASCGLALSAEEGAMWSSMEYLLAGLPVVTTVNRGGRDYYLDGRFSAHVPDDPKAIAAAVEEFAQQQISPEFIRQETIRKQQTGRAEFADAIGKMCNIDATAALMAIERVSARGHYLIFDSVDNLVAKYG